MTGSKMTGSKGTGSKGAESDKPDADEAFVAYTERFLAEFGDKPNGSFVKFKKFMVQKLGRENFEPRLSQYLEMRGLAANTLNHGMTISDALVTEFQEAAAWLALDAPNMMQMFKGELGDPISDEPPATE